jgi:hypothetical protein
MAPEKSGLLLSAANSATIFIKRRHFPGVSTNDYQFTPQGFSGIGSYPKISSFAPNPLTG